MILPLLKKIFVKLRIVGNGNNPGFHKFFSMVEYKMRTSSKSRAKRSKRKSSSGFSIKTLKSIVKLGVTGMVAMYVATWLVSIGAVTSVAGEIASVIGISKNSVLYAAKGTTVAAVALRLHKELEKL